MAKFLRPVIWVYWLWFLTLDHRRCVESNWFRSGGHTFTPELILWRGTCPEKLNMVNFDVFSSFLKVGRDPRV